MTNKPENFPAFPQKDYGGGQTALQVEGLSARDYFAAKAMQGLCAHGGTVGFALNPKDLSLRSYLIADEMLKARGE